MSEEGLNYRERKPDLETESFRAWGVRSEEKKAIIKEATEKHPIIIKQGDMKFHLTGFNKGIDKKTGKVIFAYKFKHEDKFILYYISDKISKEKQIKIKEYFFEALSQNCILINYKLQNVKETLKNIELNQKMLRDI